MSYHITVLFEFGLILCFIFSVGRNFFYSIFELTGLLGGGGVGGGGGVI
jgi:hypothetical protein